MRAWEIGSQQGAESLRLAERPDPTPGPGEVVVAVRAVSLNHRDLMVVSGGYRALKPETQVPCSDGVGEVVALGDGVTGVGPGERVTCVHFVDWTAGAFARALFANDIGSTRDGWLAEKIVLPASALVKVPDSVGDARAAPLPSAGVAAWHGVVEIGGVRAGDTVLALGTGGVSIFALQIAKLHGARVAITSSSPDKLAKARALGADIVIDTRKTPDWSSAVLEATGGAGADIIVETGGYPSLPQSLLAAAAGGRIALIGALSGAPGGELANFGMMIAKSLTLRGVAGGSRAQLTGLLRAVDAGGVAPPIDRTFAFEDAPAAYAHLKSAQHLGKVMIRV
jgi:NADPH:quinone reductase-like Zn-dependent oxidoreductase